MAAGLDLAPKVSVLICFLNSNSEVVLFPQKLTIELINEVAQRIFNEKERELCALATVMKVTKDGKKKAFLSMLRPNIDINLALNKLREMFGQEVIDKAISFYKGSDPLS